MRILVLVGFVILAGCECDPKVAPSEDAGADVRAAADLSVASVDEPTGLRWPADFSDWRDHRVKGVENLPKCQAGWTVVGLDEEFTLYKCVRFRPLTLTEEGVLSIHTRDGTVFMVTETSTFDDEEVFAEARAKVRRINATREIEVPEALENMVDRVWSVDEYFAVMSVGKGGLSLLYVNDLDELRLVMDRVDARSSPASTDGQYRIGDFEYTVEDVRKEPFLGRGPQRWDSRNDSDFIVIDYTVRNLSRTEVESDPANMVILAGERRYEPEERAEQGFMSSDRTGRYRQPLDYMKQRRRARVFELETTVSREPMLLVIYDDNERRILEFKLGDDP